MQRGSHYDSAVLDPADWINAPQAAGTDGSTSPRLLGVQLHTVHALIDRGELRAEVTVSNHRPKGRRSVRLRRQAVDEELAGL